MPDYLVDSNVILDIATEDSKWFKWSSSALARGAENGELAINPIIYAEVSVRYASIEELEEVLDPLTFRRISLPWEGAFLAGKAFWRYRRAGGRRSSPMPDFYIGAHALVSGLILMTRDPKRYQRYFPRLKLRAP